MTVKAFIACIIFSIGVVAIALVIDATFDFVLERLFNRGFMRSKAKKMSKWKP
jgi:hypothetical protein